jgi:hypothetical protein
MNRSRIVVLATVSFMCGCTAAHAGPCTAQIADVERYIKRAMAVDAGPFGQQSVGAQLHHQPTPGSVEGAQSRARAAAQAALKRAREADARGDAAACEKALDEVKQLYP